MEQRVKGTSKREQTETCFQYAEREYLRRSQKSSKREQTETCFQYAEREYLRRSQKSSKREQTETCFQYAEREYLRRSQKSSKREQTETCFQYAEREYLRRSQKSIGSSCQSMPKLTNVDSITIAKHKNGKYYLRVVFNNFGHSEIFFLSKEETRSYLLAADAMERERLKQQFAFKYLLHASGGSYDQQRMGGRKWI